MTNPLAKQAIHIQDEIYRWVESIEGIIDGTKSGIRTQQGQCTLVVEATIREQQIRVEKLIDDYPEEVIRRIKEVILNLINQ